MYIATHPRLTLRSSSCISAGGNIDPYIRVFVSALSAHSNHIYFIDARTIICSPTGLSCTFLVRRQTSCDYCWLITICFCKNKLLSAVLAAGFEGPYPSHSRAHNNSWVNFLMVYFKFIHKEKNEISILQTTYNVAI